MNERAEYPAGVPCFVDTQQQDPAAATDFYGGLFGWEFENRMPADNPQRYFIATLGGHDVAGVGQPPEGAPPVPAWNTYVSVASAGDAAASVEEAGGSVLMEPFDVLDAGRMAVVADPSGAVFCVWEPRGSIGAELVNAPGSWVFSELNTRDLDGAAAFYRSVFGWEASASEVDGLEFTMLRLPGYGDHLAESEPEIRERLAGDGAPPGFEDAVAWMSQMSADRFPDEVPAHWSVTFSVDDADAAAERAAGLGGEVVVPPFVAGPTRMAVIRDPQGAVFSISKYQPENGGAGDGG